MISAIEIYNKPNFVYREDIFAILCVNAWELLLKAVLLKENKYNMRSVYAMEHKLKKDKTPSKVLSPVLSRCGNPRTISLAEVVKRLRVKSIIPFELEQNLCDLIELRDNSIHFANLVPISRIIQELGFATIKNYMAFIKKNDIEIDLTKYNFYLMPLAYIDSKVDVEAILTDKEQNYVNLIKSQMIDEISGGEYNIVISIDIDFKKSSSIDSIGVKYDKDGLPVILTEENLRKRFPLLFKDVCKGCVERYVDFKQNRRFNDIMKRIKTNEKLCHIRKLDKSNPKSPQTKFYSTNVFQELDKDYTRK